MRQRRRCGRSTNASGKVRTDLDLNLEMAGRCKIYGRGSRKESESFSMPFADWLALTPSSGLCLDLNQWQGDDL